MATDAARYDRAILTRDQARLVAGLPWWRIVWLAFWKRRVEKAVVIGSILYIMAIAIAVVVGWLVLPASAEPDRKFGAADAVEPDSTSSTSRGARSAGAARSVRSRGAEKSFHWAHGSSKDLVRDGERLEEDKAFAAAFDFDVRINLAKSRRELIGVGAASQEGDPQRELDRAGQRARQTAEWLKECNRPAPETPIWTLTPRAIQTSHAKDLQIRRDELAAAFSRRRGPRSRSRDVDIGRGGWRPPWRAIQPAEPRHVIWPTSSGAITS